MNSDLRSILLAMSFNFPRPPSPRFTSPPSHSSAEISGWRWHEVRQTTSAIIIIAMICLLPAGNIRAGQRTNPELRIIDKPINFDQERTRLTIAYRRLHQDPKANDVIIQPKMIILHWTGISSFKATWNYFNNTRAEAAREQLASAGEVNVSAQFLVDRDGTVYRLMPENWMARHCIGLNHVAIGVENVGDDGKLPLTDAQVQADAALVRYLAAKYPITHLIGHMEYRQMEGHPYFLELDPKYRNRKPDPGKDFMAKVRALVADLMLQGPPVQ